MELFERLLRKYVPHREIGWEEIGEIFTRFQLFKSPIFNIYLHKLIAPKMHPHCHDHPWHFWAIILSGGYWEILSHGTFWRSPGTILFRNAKFKHNVVTHGVNWSLVITSPKVRQWRLIEEHGHNCKA